jgi:hypothetical protein
VPAGTPDKFGVNDLCRVLTKSFSPIEPGLNPGDVLLIDAGAAGSRELRYDPDTAVTTTMTSRRSNVG